MAREGGSIPAVPEPRSLPLSCCAARMKSALDPRTSRASFAAGPPPRPPGVGCACVCWRSFRARARPCTVRISHVRRMVLGDSRTMRIGCMGGDPESSLAGAGLRLHPSAPTSSRRAPGINLQETRELYLSCAPRFFLQGANISPGGPGVPPGGCGTANCLCSPD